MVCRTICTECIAQNVSVQKLYTFANEFFQKNYNINYYYVTVLLVGNRSAQVYSFLHIAHKWS